MGGIVEEAHRARDVLELLHRHRVGVVVARRRGADQGVVSEGELERRAEGVELLEEPLHDLLHHVRALDEVVVLDDVLDVDEPPRPRHLPVLDELRRRRREHAVPPLLGPLAAAATVVRAHAHEDVLRDGQPLDGVAALRALVRA